MTPWREALSIHERAQYDRLKAEVADLKNAMLRIRYMGQRRVRYAEDQKIAAMWADEQRV